MVHLFINNDEIEFNGEPIISYNYDLYGDVLADFTSTYTSSIDIPTTNHNLRVFGFPNISYNDVGSYNFELYNDSILFDSGIVVVDHVTTDVVSVNLFSSIIDLSTRFSEKDSFADLLENDDGVYAIKVPRYDSQAGEWVIDWKALPTGTISFQLDGIDKTYYSSAFLCYKDNSATPVNTSGYLELGIANIGKPEALDCSSYYDTDNKVYAYSDGIERQFSQTLPDKVGSGLSAAQIRVLDLQPVMPVNVILTNMLSGVVVVNDDVYTALKNYYVTLPTMRKYIEDINRDLIYVAPDTTPTTTATFSNIFTDTGSVAISELFTYGYLFDDFWGTVKPSERRYAVQCITITAVQGSNTFTKKYVVHTDGAWPHLKRVKYFLLKQFIDSADWKNNRSTFVKECGNGIYIDGLDTNIATTITVSCTGYEVTNAYTPYSYGGQVLIQRSGSTWTTSFANLSSDMRCETVGSLTNFRLFDYFKTIKSPWKLVVDLCKQFNLRFKHNSPTSLELVLGSHRYDSEIHRREKIAIPGGYYDCDTIIDLSKYLDYSTYNISPQVFDSKNIKFTPEFNDTHLDNYVDETYGKKYGQYDLLTNYPVKSEEEWFEWNILKHLSTQAINDVGVPNPGGEWTSMDMRYVSQAYDSDLNQLSIPYSLCYINNVYGSSSLVHPVYICNEVQSSDSCYYSAGKIDELVSQSRAVLMGPTSIIPGRATHVPWITTLCAGIEEIIRLGAVDECLFGSGGISPEGVTYSFDGFYDVQDQATSSTLTVNVFLKKLGMSIYDFVRGVYWIENAYYIVSKVTNYNINSEDSCEVTFIKIQDLDNYR